MGAERLRLRASLIVQRDVRATLRPPLAIPISFAVANQIEIHAALPVPTARAERAGRTVYHDSCSCLRDLGVREQPRRLLRGVSGLDLAETPESEVCCGFGGAFAAKYGEVSGEIVRKKCAALVDTGADTILAADLGCLLNIAGRLSREGSTIEVRHIAEVLAGMTDDAAIGVGEPD